MEKVDESYRQEHRYIATPEYTDASGTGVVILMQKGKLTAQASRKLSPAETTDIEHLSPLLAAQKFRPFLYRQGARTDVYNDHPCLI
jgi:hypothetical protein